jgi:hypothetical protein
MTAWMHECMKNHKLQITNSKQFTKNKSQIPNKNCSCFVILVIGHCDFFVIWCLGFVNLKSWGACHLY